MDTELGRNLILWTVRASVALYVVAIWRYLFYVRRRPTNDRAYITAWAASWLLCVLHVLFAYHFEHHWDQAAAELHTAEMTKRVVGWDWAGGLYVNYVFLFVWGADVLRMLTNSSRVSSFAMHAVAAFMMLNATVVFGPTWWWIPLAMLVFGMLWKKRQQPRTALDADTAA